MNLFLYLTWGVSALAIVVSLGTARIRWQCWRSVQETAWRNGDDAFAQRAQMRMDAWSTAVSWLIFASFMLLLVLAGILGYPLFINLLKFGW